MTAAFADGTQHAKLLIAEARGNIRHLPRAALGSLFEAGDLVVANDAATLPASLKGIHEPSGEEVEVRLAGWVALNDPARFIALAFGDGDHRLRTEDRPPPPPLSRGDGLMLGLLEAKVEQLLGHARLVLLRFVGSPADVIRSLARHGRPIQYAHAPDQLALWDMWTPIAAAPIAFEPPSAGFALNWRTLAAWRGRGVRFATLSHAAGLSSTGDAELDRQLPLDEVYDIPKSCASAVLAAKRGKHRVIAIGTTVVRALEAATSDNGAVRPGAGIARGRIGRGGGVRTVNAVLTGVHQPGESHFELIKAFANDDRLSRIQAAAGERGYRGHEFGDSVLIEREEPGA